MNLEEAIKTAIEYERKIRDLYREQQAHVIDPAGRRLFEMLGDDEQYHLDYLEKQLAIWQDTGQLPPGRLVSTLPPPGVIERHLEKLQTELARDDRKDEQQMLSKALHVETETSDFYRQMVETLPEPGKTLFAGFLKIEDQHIAAVQAELDFLTRSGYWFDIKEFDME